MKKLLIITCAMCVLSGVANANEKIAKPDVLQKDAGIEKNLPKMPSQEQIRKIRKAHENAFEQKLGLTEVQKLKARELRKSSHAKIEPVMRDIRAKKQEAEAVRNSKLTVQAQEEKLTAIDNDLKVLEKQAKEIRQQNMKDFEAILTKDQKKTLKNMKKEGRKKFDNRRKELLPPPPLKQNEIK